MSTARQPFPSNLAAVVPFLALLALPAVPLAADEAQPWRLDLFASLAYSSNYGFESSPWGVRGSYQPSGSWAYELSLTEVARRRDEAWVADFSAKRYLGDPGRLSWYLLGGAGYAFGDDDNEPFVADRDGAGLHFGGGVEIELSDQLSLRPEARARWYDDSDDAFTQELTVGLGWRF